MLISQENIVFQLAEGMHLVVKKAQGGILECTEGMLWLTVEGQLADILLAGGVSMCINGAGKVIVQGLPSASFKLSQQAARVNRGIANR